MTPRSRLDVAHPHVRRQAIGALVSSDCDRVTAALVVAVGRGPQLQAELVDASSCHVPRQTKAIFDWLTRPGTAEADCNAAGALTMLSSRLAEILAAVVGNLVARTGPAKEQLLAVGVDDPGLWSSGHPSPGGYLALCDAARLAELTGMNIIDAFPARDVARGGQGGPVTALPEWVLLRHADRSRVLLDLGRTVRMTYLPGGRDDASRIRSFQVGPGMQMLDQLTHRLTSGEHDFDPGGRMAVQGRRIQRLQEDWLSDPYFGRPLPRWQPLGVRPERFLLEAVQRAADAGWSVRDLLCTATHFIAETIALAMRRCLPSDSAVDEIVLTGGGQHNGMLLQEIAARLPHIPITRLGQFGHCGQGLDPACIALLALLHLDQVPANLPAVTGTRIPRVLGRLTPGSPQNWQRLVGDLTSSTPGLQSLKRAG
jgi:anhydro-N-acetylmuramic acid kinase